MKAGGRLMTSSGGHVGGKSGKYRLIPKTFANAAHSLTPACALVGRDSEMAVLARLMTEVVAGRGNAILIEGEPGIGKSTLVRAALAEAAEAGCEVFWGAGDELGQELLLQPLLEGLRVDEPSTSPRRNAIIRLLRGEDADRGMDVPSVVAEQLLAIIAEQCAVGPTVLVIDDLQWADHASITLWRRLARSVEQMPLLLVAMMRPVPQRDDLRALQRAAGDGARLQLSGLSEAAVTALVTALAGGAPTGQLLELARSAAGNPLYLVELVAALVRSSSVTITGAGAAEVTSGSVPSSLSAAIADRLGFVSGPVRALLHVAALLGDEFAVPDLAIVAGRRVADLIAALDEARAAGVLAESGSHLRFRHPLIRSALYQEIPAPVRAALHQDAGRALADAGAPVDRVARQLVQAVSSTDEPMDDWILSWLAHTAGPLIGQAPQVAAELLRQAVAGCPADSAHHDLLVGRLADALYRVGETAEAEQVARQALAQATDPDVLVDLHRTLAQYCMLVGRFTESLTTLDQALATPGISARHRARLLVLTARTLSNLGQEDKAGQVATTALEVASEAADSWAMAWALHVMTIVTAVQGRFADAMPLFDRALTVAQADPTLIDLRLLLQINKAVTLGGLDRHEEAFAAARQAQHLAGQAGMVIRQAQAHSALGKLLFDVGRWAEALAEVLAQPEDLKEPIAACIDLGIAALICFHRGEIQAARRYLSTALPYIERVGNRVIGPLALARSLDFEQGGALTEALAVLTSGLAENAEELDDKEDLLADAVRLAVKTGDLATARSVAQHAATLAVGSEIPHRQANALYCRGLLDRDSAWLLTAAERYRNAGRLLLCAQALEAATANSHHAGDRDQAQDSGLRSIEIYTSLGAVTDVARLQAMLRAQRGPDLGLGEAGED
jgi:tetratricopeptide (TPR) repeat protein